MDFYAVDNYIDQIRIRPEKKWCAIMKRYDAVYFDTEQEAKYFIVERARDKLRKAEDQLLAAKRKLQRVLKKFGDAPRKIETSTQPSMSKAE